MDHGPCRYAIPFRHASFFHQIPSSMIRCAFVTLFFAIGSMLSAKELPTTTSINAVKVFLSGAEITRTGRASLPAGTSTVIFTGLSQEADPSDIQVNGQALSPSSA